jgi:hypothetical protein
LHRIRIGSHELGPERSRLGDTSQGTEGEHACRAALGEQLTAGARERVQLAQRPRAITALQRRLRPL